MFRILSLIALLLAGACRSTHLQPRQEYDDTITHAGVIADLARGRYDGFFAVSNLFRYGNHGLGTFDRLDGEMIIHQGVVYRADAESAVSLAPLSTTTPFAVVTYFSPERFFDLEHADQQRIQRALNMRRSADVPEAVEISGLFSTVRFRSVPAQSPPYQPLDEVVQASQKVFTLTNVVGVMVGYYFPAEFSALHPAGYHLHFIDAERKRGGHVLDFEAGQVRIAIDVSPNLLVLVPSNRPVARPLMPMQPPAGRRQQGKPEQGDVTTRR